MSVAYQNWPPTKHAGVKHMKNYFRKSQEPSVSHFHWLPDGAKTSALTFKINLRGAVMTSWSNRCSSGSVGQKNRKKQAETIRNPGDYEALREKAADPERRLWVYWVEAGQ